MSTRISGIISHIPYARFIDLGVRKVDGELLFIMPFQEKLVGNKRIPALHGGVVGAFLEISALLSLMHRAPEERVPKTINFSIDYLRSAGPEESFAATEVVKQGRRVANVRVVGWQKDRSKPFASARGNFLL